MGLRREDLKVGGVYINARKCEVKVTAIGVKDILAIEIYDGKFDRNEYTTTIDFVIKEWKLKPKDKRRYWIWTELNDGLPYKISYYLDDEGRRPDGAQWTKKSNLLKKHEDEFIDIEVE